MYIKKKAYLQKFHFITILRLQDMHDYEYCSILTTMLYRIISYGNSSDIMKQF